jgi:hypothetical protein
LTTAEIKNQVTCKYQEGQQITLWIMKGEKGTPTPIKVKILTFNPNSVLTEHNGYKESFSYWEVKTLSAKPLAKDKEVFIPEKLKAEGHHKYNPVVASY